MVNTEGLILDKTDCEVVRKHDYDIYEHNHTITLSQVENIVDLGYLGDEKDLPTVKSVPPIRKNTLALGSTCNKKRSILRIIVEHKICKIKKFGIM